MNDESYYVYGVKGTTLIISNYSSHTKEISFIDQKNLKDISFIEDSLYQTEFGLDDFKVDIFEEIQTCIPNLEVQVLKLTFNVSTRVVEVDLSKIKASKPATKKTNKPRKPKEESDADDD